MPLIKAVLLILGTWYTASLAGATADRAAPRLGEHAAAATTIWPSSTLAEGSDAASGRYAGDVIVFTANQGWLSRIYVLRMDGSVLNYFEYTYYIFSDLEVVENEVYVTDWVAPRVYKVDIETGALETIVDDWSLYYLYDLAWDGAYFYAKEWSLNRYTLDGTFAGSASVDETIRGSAWDGVHYWTLSDEGELKRWDLSGWPTITEVPGDFAPPTSTCRGLWHDGQHFWTAERIDGVIGHIYRFQPNGMIVRQWTEPAFAGYAACVVTLGLPGDIDDDGDVDLSDLAALLAAYDTCQGDADYNPAADFDESGCVDLIDLGALLGNYGV